MCVCVRGELGSRGGGVTATLQTPLLPLALLSVYVSFSLSLSRSLSLSGYNYANSMYIAVASEAWGVLKALRSFSPVTVLGCY